MITFTESVLADAPLAWLEELYNSTLHDPEIAAGELAAERADPNFCDVILGELEL